MKKKVFIVLMAAAILVSLGAFASSNSSDETIADTNDTAAGEMYLVVGETTDYILDLEAAAMRAAEDEGYDLEILNAGGNIDLETQMIEIAAQNTPSAIMVLPYSSDETTSIIKAAGDTDVVFLNRELTDTSVLDEEHVYIGPDETYSGQYQGEILVDYCQENNLTELDALLLTGPEKLEHTQRRNEGVKKALEDAGITVNYTELPCSESSEIAKKKIEKEYQSKDIDFDVIISNNDAMANGAVRAFEEIGKDIDGIPVLGIDGTDQALTYIDSGKMYGSVLQELDQVTYAVKACANLMEGKVFDFDLENAGAVKSSDSDYIYFSNWEKITADNVKDYLN